MKMSEIKRIEVTFKSGKFVSFPDVDSKTIEHDVGSPVMTFEFGEGEKHGAVINLTNVDFIELMAHN